MEDDELLAAIRWQLEQLSAPAPNGAQPPNSNTKAKRQKKRRTNG
jgi:hypothetical protein